jgi:predicted DNA-binding transcriptional regulator AlpA
VNHVDCSSSGEYTVEATTVAVAQAEPLLTKEQVSLRLGVCKRTVGIWTEMGVLPEPLRKGHKWVRWRAGDIEAFLAKLDQQRQAAAV